MESRPGPASLMLEAVNGPGRATPSALIKLAGTAGFSAREAKSALKELVDRGALEYVCENATVFAVPSFAGQVRTGARLFLCRPGLESPLPFEGAVPLILREGASFGSGRHPTTRICLALLDDACALLPDNLRERALDVGTGSGVLAIAALKLGIGRALGLDREPDAVAEARNNAAINGVAERFSVSGEDAAGVDGFFGLVLANLRAPTLFSLLAFFAEKLREGGFLVVSGLHPEEAAIFAKKAADHAFALKYRLDEGAWSGISLRKTNG